MWLYASADGATRGHRACARTTREALLRAVVLDALGRTRAAAEHASSVEGTFEALATYLRAALGLRVSAVIPQVLDLIGPDDTEVAGAREASAQAVAARVDAARDSGELPADVTFADVGMMLVRIARPLPGPMPTELEDELARRHLELFIRGLRVLAEGDLTGPALSREDLAALVADVHRSWAAGAAWRRTRTCECRCRVR
jgi:hypothetical protein